MEDMPKTKDEFYMQQTKEQLIIFLHNKDLIIKSLQNRMYALTGCEDYGRCDGMNGACITCFYDERDLWEKCNAFRW